MPKSKRCKVHTYKKVKYYSATVYRCMKCTHRIEPELLEGLDCICYKCGLVFTISTSAAKLTRPVCDGCRKIKKFDTSLVEDLLK